MAKLIKTNGEVEIISPKNGRTYELDELQGYVGGYIEIVYIKNDEIMVVNEEGIYECEFNINATMEVPQEVLIYGDVVICKNEEIE